MKKIVEHILMLAASCVIVIFLIYMMLQGDFSQGEGIMDALSHTPYISHENIDVSLTNSFNTNTSASSAQLAYDNSMCYLFNVDDDETMTNIYSKFSVECNGNTYKWNASNRRWQCVSDPANFCYIYIQDILDESGISAYSIGAFSDVETNIVSCKILFDDITGDILFFSAGTYHFYVKVTDVNKNVSEQMISIPVKIKEIP